MNDNTKAFLQKSWYEPRLFFFWLSVFTLSFCFAGLLFAQMQYGRQMSPAIAWPIFISLVLFVLSVPAFVLAWIPPVRRGMAWLLRRRWLVFAGLLTLIALFEALENWRGQRAWESFKREAAMQGEKLETADVIPPQVPDDQNFAAAPVFKPLWNEFDPAWRTAHTSPSGGYTNEENGFKLTLARAGQSPEDAIGNWALARRTDLKRLQEYYRAPAGTASSGAVGNEFPIAPKQQSPAEEVLYALGKYDAIIAQMRAAEARPSARFPVRYEDAFACLLPHLSDCKGCVQVLIMRANAELELSQSEKALADVKLALRVMESVKDEPLLISQLVRIAQIQIILQPIWEGIVAHRWSDAQLLALQEQLAQLDFLASFRTGMSGERAFSISTMNLLRRERDLSILASPEETGAKEVTPLQHSFEESFGKIVAQVIPGGWFEQNKVSLGRMHRDYILPPVDLQKHLVSPAAVEDASERMIRKLDRLTPYDWVGPAVLPALNKAAERCARAQASVDLARVACALERHRLVSNAYPESLDAMTPQFINQLPHDVINGQPLRYRRSGDGEFILYSVGWNAIDDNGKTAQKKDSSMDWKQGDWVWRFPASKDRVTLE